MRMPPFRRQLLRIAPMMLPLLASVLVGCSGPQNFLFAGGPAAGHLARLGWIALITFSVVTVLVWVLLVLAVTRRRGSFDEHAPVEPEPSRTGVDWIIVGGIAIPLLILTVLFVLTLGTLGHFPMKDMMTPAPAIRVTGRQWWFEGQYLDGGLDGRFKVATELHIPAGRPVNLELVTRDVIHSFWIPKLHGKVDLVPGIVNHIRIQADRPGIYEGECGEYCGAQHAHMRLRVIADTPAVYARWRRGQLADAHDPADAATRHGREVFLSSACALCHTIRGTPAQGDVGPDLTHVGSRGRIAGGMLDNNTANLAAWIVHAQSLKPGAQMPDMDQLDGDQLRDLTSYLQSLK
jgi:cytochrome c oxidase subunit II